MKVRELLEMLADPRIDKDAEVIMEGCDCSAGAAGVEYDGVGMEFYMRRDGSGLTIVNYTSPTQGLPTHDESPSPFAPPQDTSNMYPGFGLKGKGE